MASNSADRLSLLRPEGGDISESSNANVSPPLEPPMPSIATKKNHRRGYEKMGSQDSIDPSPRYQSPTLSDASQSTQGLGITNAISRSIGSVTRKPVAAQKANPSPPTPSNPFFQTTPENRTPEIRTPEVRSPNTPSSTASSRTPVSPPWQRYESQYGRGEGLRAVTEVDEESINKGKHTNTVREDLLQTPDQFSGNQGFRRVSDNDDNSFDLDHDEAGKWFFALPRSITDFGLELLGGCPSYHNIHSHRTSWLSISILFLSIYSTVFSGIYLVVACVAPRYGHRISSKGGTVNISTASTLFALFAKTIELSFVTVFVTFLGQVLSRRSLMKTDRGVTIAEMTMRSWVIQPGSMITHWQNLRYAGLSILGVITLTAALVATFYTTASDALVSPNLKFGGLESREMVGMVKMNYADSTEVAADCQTPIPMESDSDKGVTCLQLQHAGQGKSEHSVEQVLELIICSLS